jgi:DNA-binding transcriptional ArsR family regulator
MPARAGRPRGPEALHALAHPLRVRIRKQLREPASAARLAPVLEQDRQVVDYHLRELERRAGAPELTANGRRGLA